MAKSKPSPRSPLPVAKKTGRPVGSGDLYQEEYAEQAFRLCLLGHVNSELAHYFGVAMTTLESWLAEHPPFREALKNGREDADAAVATSLYRRATGIVLPDVSVNVVARGLNQGSDVVITPIDKHLPPDVAAANIWLKNRRSKLWKERQGEGGSTDPAVLAAAIKGVIDQIDNDLPAKPAAEPEAE